MGKAVEIASTDARTPGALVWSAFALIVVPTLFRASVSIAPFPHWGLDPFLYGSGTGSVGPTAVIALDALTCLGCALAVLGAARVRTWIVAAFGIGAAGVVVHGVGSVEHVAEGTHWVGAMAAGVGAMHLGQHERVRRMVVACALGWLALLVAKGIEQYVVEHPMTVEVFDRDPERALRAQGLTPGSSGALIYERRLRQPAATGWFGLANIFASFAACGVVALGAMAVGAWRATRERLMAACLALGAVACAVGLALTGSKGAQAAAVAGVIAVVVLRFVPASGRLRRALPWATACVPIAVIALVLLRGVIGERVGELSILFRSFYLRGAFEAWRSHPFLGVGPAGFKDAYLLVRPPTSPEEVSSPHALLVDWASMLGVFGLAWGAIFGAWAFGAGKGTENQQQEEPPSTLARDTRVVFLVGAVVVVASAYVERHATTAETAAMRAAGILGWVALGWAVLRAHGQLSPRGVRAALCAAALTLIAHAQLDLTGVHAGSAPVLMVLIASLVGDGASVTTGARGVGRRWMLAGVPAGLGLAIGFLGAPIFAWESHLNRAARAADDVRAMVEEGASTPGVRVDPRPGVLEAAGELTLALDARPTHLGTRRALAKVLINLGSAEPGVDTGSGARSRGVRVSDEGTRVSPGRAGAWMWAGTANAGLADDPAMSGRADALREAALDAWTRAAGLDPHGLDAPVRLMRLCDRMGRGGDAARWATRALEVDANFRLDPLKQLSDADRRLAERLARGAPGPGGP